MADIDPSKIADIQRAIAQTTSAMSKFADMGGEVGASISTALKNASESLKGLAKGTKDTAEIVKIQLLAAYEQLPEDLQNKILPGIRKFSHEYEKITKVSNRKVMEDFFKVNKRLEAAQVDRLSKLKEIFVRQGKSEEEAATLSIKAVMRGVEGKLVAYQYEVAEFERQQGIMEDAQNKGGVDAAKDAIADRLKRQDKLTDGIQRNETRSEVEGEQDRVKKKNAIFADALAGRKGLIAKHLAIAARGSAKFGGVMEASEKAASTGEDPNLGGGVFGDTGKQMLMGSVLEMVAGLASKLLPAITAFTALSSIVIFLVGVFDDMRAFGGQAIEMMSSRSNVFADELGATAVQGAILENEIKDLRWEAAKMGIDFGVHSKAASDAMKMLGTSTEDTYKTFRAFTEISMMAPALGISQQKAFGLASKAVTLFGLRGQEVVKYMVDLKNSAAGSGFVVEDLAGIIESATGSLAAFGNESLKITKYIVDMGIKANDVFENIDQAKLFAKGGTTLGGAGLESILGLTAATGAGRNATSLDKLTDIARSGASRHSGGMVGFLMGQINSIAKESGMGQTEKAFMSAQFMGQDYSRAYAMATKDQIALLEDSSTRSKTMTDIMASAGDIRAVGLKVSQSQLTFLEVIAASVQLMAKSMLKGASGFLIGGSNLTGKDREFLNSKSILERASTKAPLGTQQIRIAD